MKFFREAATIRRGFKHEISRRDAMQASRISIIKAAIEQASCAVEALRCEKVDEYESRIFNTPSEAVALEEEIFSIDEIIGALDAAIQHCNEVSE